MQADAEFTRETLTGQQVRVTAYFSTVPAEVTATRDLDLATVAAQLSSAVDNWNSRGSGFVLDRITKFMICITIFRPMHRSSYSEAPEYIKNKQCIINVKNDDQKCFIWSVLAALYPQKVHPDRVTKYEPIERTLNVQDLKFSLRSKYQSSRKTTRRFRLIFIHWGRQRVKFVLNI